MNQYRFQHWLRWIIGIAFQSIAVEIKRKANALKCNKQISPGVCTAMMVIYRNVYFSITEPHNLGLIYNREPKRSCSWIREFILSINVSRELQLNPLLLSFFFCCPQRLLRISLLPLVLSNSFHSIIIILFCPWFYWSPCITYCTNHRPVIIFANSECRTMRPLQWK